MGADRIEHRLQAVAGRIADLMLADGGLTADLWPEVRDRNARDGWTIEVRYADGEYLSADDHTRIEGLSLGEAALRRAYLIACAWARGAETEE